jgi:hypothetical protein
MPCETKALLPVVNAAGRYGVLVPPVEVLQQLPTANVNAGPPNRTGGLFGGGLFGGGVLGVGPGWGSGCGAGGPDGPAVGVVTGVVGVFVGVCSGVGGGTGGGGIEANAFVCVTVCETD